MVYRAQVEKRTRHWLLLAALVFVFVFGILFNAQSAGAICMNNPDDCYSKCPAGYSQDNNDRMDCVEIYSEDTDRLEGCYRYAVNTLSGTGRWITSGENKKAGVKLCVSVTLVVEQLCSESVQRESGCTHAAKDLGFEEGRIKTGGIFADVKISGIIQIGLIIILSLLFVFFLFLIIKNGILYSGSADDENKKKVAIKGIVSGFVGFLITFGSFLILSIMFDFFGISPFKEDERIIPVECENVPSGDAKERCIKFYGE